MMDHQHPDADSNAETACVRVLRTVELLEGVLLQLARQQAVSARRVCRLWQDTMDESHDIQVALCFKSMGLCRLDINTDAGELEGIHITTTDITSKLENGEFKKVALSERPTRGDSQTTMAELLCLFETNATGRTTTNPVLHTLFPGVLRCPADRIRQLARNSPAAWHHLLLTQPATSAIHVWLSLQIARAGLTSAERTEITKNFNRHGWQIEGGIPPIWERTKHVLVRSNEGPITLSALLNFLLRSLDSCISESISAKVCLQFYFAGAMLAV
jgi:hypothetical protein